jgi:hypothetical protein
VGGRKAWLGDHNYPIIIKKIDGSTLDIFCVEVI